MRVFENFHMNEVGFVTELVLHCGEDLYLGTAGGADAESWRSENHHQRLPIGQSLIHRQSVKVGVRLC